MEKGKWIFLVNKLPTVVSPPLGWYECPMELGFYFGKSEEDMKPRYKETA